jgi:hypothetical protein
MAFVKPPARRIDANKTITRDLVPLTASLDPDVVLEERSIDGDASTHLEELVVGALPSFDVADQPDTAVAIELVGPQLRLAGSVGIGNFRRLSDFLNHHVGLIELRDATILRRNGDPTKVKTRSIWVSPTEVTIVGQHEGAAAQPSSPDFIVPKVPKGLIVVTPGHTLTGQVYITSEAQLSSFIESTDPAFIPMTDVRTRSLADRRIITRYPFAMLNRRHIVAATELQPGMVAGRSVL